MQAGGRSDLGVFAEMVAMGAGVMLVFGWTRLASMGRHKHAHTLNTRLWKLFVKSNMVVFGFV